MEKAKLALYTDSLLSTFGVATATVTVTATVMVTVTETETETETATATATGLSSMLEGKSEP